MQKTHFTLSTLICSIACLMFIQPTYAQDMNSFGMGAKASTLGVGAEVSGRVMDNLSLRLGLQGLAYDYDDTYSDVDYEAELELFSGMLLADWHPFGNNFRLSAGVMLNENDLTVTGTPRRGTYNIGGVTYTSAQVGSLSGSVDFNTIAPYAGIGYGGSFSDDSNWSFFCDVGILFQGSASVSLSATGTMANNPNFQARLEQERKDLEEDIDEYEYYPVISLGVMYKF